MREGEGSSAARQRTTLTVQRSLLSAALQHTSGVLPTGSRGGHGRCLSSGSGCVPGGTHQSGRSDCSQAPGRVVQVCTCKARHLIEQPALLPGGFSTRLLGGSCVTQLLPGGVVQVRVCLSCWLDLA